MGVGLRTLGRVNVLIAPDKFKGTLTAREAAEAIARGWRKIRPDDELDLLPITDGGDGFGTVMSEFLGAKEQRTRSRDAAHRECNAVWWWDAKSKTAIVETARVIGLAMLPRGKFHPFELDTFGVGAVLRAAQRKGAKQILAGIGGSATNDGGFGMARALGWKFLTADQKLIERWTELSSLATIVPPPRSDLPQILVAVDVQNKLLGKFGATRVYGPQKGVRPADYPVADACLGRLARVCKRTLDRDHAAEKGTGAAGGLGFGLRAFTDAELTPGFDLFARRAKLLHRVRGAELVITGEGSIDDSTAMGKGVGELAQTCRQHEIPCLGLAGRAARTRQVTKLFKIVQGLTDFQSVEAALRHPKKSLTQLAERVAREWSQQKLASD